VIPNVKRIKLEKLRVGEYMEWVQSRAQKGPSRDFEEDQIIDNIKTVTPFSYYYENIFIDEDFYLYRAVLLTYSGEYEKAIEDFELSLSKKGINKEENQNSDSDSETSNNTDLSDIGLCSLNIHEAKFNKVICHILLEDYDNAIKLLTYLIDHSPVKYGKKLYLLRGLIFQEIYDEQIKSK